MNCVRHFERYANAIRSRPTPWSCSPIIFISFWTLPEGDADFATRWRQIKSAFSRKLPIGEAISGSRAAKGERGIWQRRYWEHTIRDENDFGRHIDYVHINPVKHGLVTRVRDWPYSSFHRMVRLGVYPEDWAGDAAELSGDFGERSWCGDK
jgi:REP-associated tyrosine transposase